MTAAVEPDLPSHYAARTRRLQLQAAAGALAAVLAAAALAAAAARACVPRQLLCAWLVAEAAFVFVWRAKLRHLNQVPPDHRPPRHDGAATADRFYRLRHFFPFSEGYLRPWFRCVCMCASRSVPPPRRAPRLSAGRGPPASRGPHAAPRRRRQSRILPRRARRSRRPAAAPRALGAPAPAPAPPFLTHPRAPHPAPRIPPCRPPGARPCTRSGAATCWTFSAMASTTAPREPPVTD